MELRFVKISVVYLLVGGVLGLAMGISGKFQLASVHTHLLLLGWASLALAGLVYHWYPQASATRLARFHFWLHNIGLPAFMIGLALLLTGSEWALPLVAGASIVVTIGLALFAVNVLFNAKARIP
jgi:hypothetical protein